MDRLIVRIFSGWQCHDATMVFVPLWGGHQQDFHPEKRNLMLKELGECMQCSSKCESEICVGEKNNETEEAVQSQMGLITGCSFAFIIFILVVVIVVVLMKRKKVAHANQRRSKDEYPI